MLTQIRSRVKCLLLNFYTCMGFEIRKKEKFKKAEEFAMRIKDVYEEVEVTLRKS